MKAPKCPDGCGVTAIPILSMNRGAEQKYMHPEADLGCPACGEVWQGAAGEAESADRAEQRAYARVDAEGRRAERQRKADELRARLAAAPKAVP